MRKQIKQFEILNVRLNEVESFIKLIETQKKLSAEYKQLVDKSSIPLINLETYMNYAEPLNNSLVQYNAIIISIYACFENYIDELCKCYLQLYFDNILKFDDFPEKVITNYFKQAGEFLSNPQRYSGLELSPEIVIRHLHGNIKNDRNMPLLNEFLLAHGGNLKIDKVIDLFANLGIANIRARIQNNYIFKKYISETKDASFEQVSALLGSSKNIYLELERLVDARNNVAHGWNEDDRMAFSSIISDTIPFIRCLCNVLLEIILIDAFELLLKSNKLMKYDAAIQVFSNKILCINNKLAKLEIGDYIFYEDTQNNFHVAHIDSLQINGSNINKIEENNIEVGIGLDRSIKGTYQFYYI